jgi:pimeloyl-ACP methyl ester carboxylesterase
MKVSLRHVEAAVGDRVLRGTAYVPLLGAGRCPTAVLHHGFGGQRTEASRLFVTLARELSAGSVATVAFDRAGHGESDGEFEETTVSEDVADSLELLDRIVGWDFVDGEDVHLVGISMGAVIASVVAAESEVPVRSLTLWSVAAMFVDELRAGLLQGRRIAELDERGYFDFRGMRVGRAFFDDAVTFDVYGRAVGYDGPVRVLHGGRDFIPAHYAERYAEVYGSALDFTLVPDGDHCWETVTTRDFVLRETVRFIIANSAR